MTASMESNNRKLSEEVVRVAVELYQQYNPGVSIEAWIAYCTGFWMGVATERQNNPKEILSEHVSKIQDKFRS